MSLKNKIDFREVLSDSSRAVADIAVELLHQNPELFGNVMKLVLEDKNQISMRAARVAEMFAEKYPEYLMPYFDEIMLNLCKYKVDGVRRGFLKFFLSKYHLLNEEQTGWLVDNCFTFLQSPQEPIAVRHYSSQILYKIILQEPDLKNEFIAVLEDLAQKNNSSICRMCNKLLKKIRSNFFLRKA